MLKMNLYFLSLSNIDFCNYVANIRKTQNVVSQFNRNKFTGEEYVIQRRNFD